MNKTLKGVVGLVAEAEDKSGVSQAQAARSLEISRQAVSKQVKKALLKGLIRVKSKGKPVVYALTSAGRAYLLGKAKEKPSPKSTTGSRCIRAASKFLLLHKTIVKFPIVSIPMGGFQTRPDLEVQLNNWLKRYVERDEAYPLEVSCIEVTTKSVEVRFHPVEFVQQPGWDREALEWLSEMMYQVRRYMEARHNIILGRGHVVDDEISSSVKEHESEIDPSLRVKVNLGYQAKGILGGPKYDKKGSEKEAWAKIDRSKPFNPQRLPEIDSNDIEYMRRLVTMPDKVDDLWHLTPELREYSAEIRGHLEAVRAISSASRKMEKSGDRLAVASERMASASEELRDFFKTQNKKVTGNT